jgi:hypothetical protein
VTLVPKTEPKTWLRNNASSLRYGLDGQPFKMSAIPPIVLQNSKIPL